MQKDSLYWIALSMVPGIGPVLFKRLISRFGTAKKVFDAPLHSLKEVEGIGDKLAFEIHSSDRWGRAKEEVERAEGYGAAIVTMADEGYPKGLLNIYDPPPFLYAKGVIGSDERAIAIVGSRFASTYGKITTERLARELAENGFTIVSGMARGIDTSAHRGAVSANGRTIAVLGSGVDVAYPPENRKLYEEISENGAVISEFPMGTGPLSENFPTRNRVISGMSLGVVIVEASLKSGSLITASCAAEQGREVFAVPGNINSKVSKGTNRLIKEGAKLVEDVNDILEEFDLMPGTGAPRCIPSQKNLTREEAAIVEALSEPAQIDEIANLSKMDISSVSAILLNLELNGVVRQLPGMVFARNF